MREQPQASDLVRAVADFLRNDVMPELSGRKGFHARVAANVLDTVERELQRGETGRAAELARLQALLSSDESDAEALNEALCTAIREGRIAFDDPALTDHLWATTLDTLAIDQPRYATYRAVSQAGDTK